MGEFVCVFWVILSITFTEAANARLEHIGNGYVGEGTRSWWRNCMLIAEQNQTTESRPVVPDQNLLVRPVLIREEAWNMMGGGVLDVWNDRAFTALPEAEVNFLSKLVAL